MPFISFKINKTRAFLVIKTTLRHGFVSICCGCIEYFSFIYLLQSKEFDLKISYVLSYFLATLLGYILHNYYTFRVKSLKIRTLLLYIFQSLITLSLGFSIVYILIAMNIVPQISKAIQLASTFFFNIAFGRYVTFKFGNL